VLPGIFTVSPGCTFGAGVGLVPPEEGAVGVGTGVGVGAGVGVGLGAGAGATIATLSFTGVLAICVLSCFAIMFMPLNVMPTVPELPAVYAMSYSLVRPEMVVLNSRGVFLETLVEESPGSRIIPEAAVRLPSVALLTCSVSSPPSVPGALAVI
jgi:hypothetical protein